jgi:hypothetical protein
MILQIHLQVNKITDRWIWSYNSSIDGADWKLFQMVSYYKFWRIKSRGRYTMELEVLLQKHKIIHL